MKISTIKKTFWIPKDGCFYVKERETPNDDSSLTRVEKSDTRLDDFEPKQIFYILDSNPKLVLEFPKHIYDIVMSKISQ